MPPSASIVSLASKALSQIGIGANLHNTRPGNRHCTRTIDPALRVHGDDLAVVNENVARALVHLALLQVPRRANSQPNTAIDCTAPLDCIRACISWPGLDIFRPQRSDRP